jgi:uncharacterized protein YecT (DUF1311 family)
LIEKDYQNCLDKGEYMYGCSIHYYNQMDSCLNVIYNQSMRLLKENSKEKLKKEQLIWLKSREHTFELIDKTNKDEGQDGEMIRKDLKADYVKERVLFLIQRIEKTPYFSCLKKSDN